MNIWWMWDNHSFTHCKGTIDESIVKIMECANKDPYGMAFAKDDHSEVTVALAHGPGKDWPTFMKEMDKFKVSIENYFSYSI